MVATPPRPPTPGTTGETPVRAQAPGEPSSGYASKDAVIEAIDTLGRNIDRRFVRLEDGQTTLIEGQKTLERRMYAVEDRVATVEDRLASVEHRLTSVEYRLTKLEDGQQTIITVMNENHAELNRKFELLLAAVTAPKA